MALIISLRRDGDSAEGAEENSLTVRPSGLAHRRGADLPEKSGNATSARPTFEARNGARREQPAEVIIFPGVRYERWQQSEAQSGHQPEARSGARSSVGPGSVNSVARDWLEV